MGKLMRSLALFIRFCLLFLLLSQVTAQRGRVPPSEGIPGRSRLQAPVAPRGPINK
ncbi:hypothetical protein H6P81_001161 [Aristolochia fimbriata]|uniref:Uncharacterized protein n=1 Tax=Aristolochia fimbriata TaxID=158543 RepID=A0AAV7F6E7_ARIFI|nr:hypothetical protein H6P81_001161 [Aristolochia fimbriata]